MSIVTPDRVIPTEVAEADLVQRHWFSPDGPIISPAGKKWHLTAGETRAITLTMALSAVTLVIGLLYINS